MPELPEVETTRRGIAPYIIGQPIAAVIVRNRRLRWPVPRNLATALVGNHIDDVGRRAKYLLFRTASGTMLLHLGMSGSLRIIAGGQPPAPHDHVDIVFAGGQCLRFHDPRRFGSIHWTRAEPERHRLLRSLGPEPLEDGFCGAYLYRQSRQRRQSIKTFIMDGRVVVGVGNIYASESLFAAGIHPHRPAGRISLERYDLLAAAIAAVLRAAIHSGGTTLRDFVNGVGEPGYFRQELKAYDRAGEPCNRCGGAIRVIRLGQRSTFYCPSCQR